MSSVIGRALTLVGGAILGTAAILALAGGWATAPLLATGAGLALGMFLIYS